jgi:hypothetical protein
MQVNPATLNQIRKTYKFIQVSHTDPFILTDDRLPISGHLGTRQPVHFGSLHMFKSRWRRLQESTLSHVRNMLRHHQIHPAAFAPPTSQIAPISRGSLKFRVFPHVLLGHRRYSASLGRSPISLDLPICRVVAVRCLPVSTGQLSKSPADAGW